MRHGLLDGDVSHDNSSNHCLEQPTLDKLHQDDRHLDALWNDHTFLQHHHKNHHWDLPAADGGVVQGMHVVSIYLTLKLT